MKDSTKYAILGLLAVGLIVNGIYFLTKDDTSTPSGKINKIQAGTNTNTPAVNTNNSVANSNPATPNQNPTTPPATATEGTSANMPKTTLAWSETEHDFGTIQQDSENTHIFTFTNNGTEPLIIEKAKGSCGCTVPEYPKEPIPPGESNEIKVVYKPGKQKNNQTKKVTVTANTEPVQTILTIKANVLVPEGQEG
ncbi:MAG: DUF1573 domain-containing protein [Bacteroidota bacterium]